MAPGPVEIARMLAERWNRGDADGFVELFHDEAEVRSAWDQALRGGFSQRGHRGVRAWMAEVRETVDLRIEVDSLLPYGPLVLLLGAAHTRAHSGGPALEQQYGAICRVEDGRVRYLESHFDHGDAIASFGRHVKARPSRAGQAEVVPAEADAG